MRLSNLLNNKKNLITSLIIALVFIFSQATVGIPTTHAANGTAKIFIIEVFIVLMGIYTIFWRLMVKRELSKASVTIKYYFVLMFAFGIFYLLTFIYRYITHMPLISSFLLARIIVEICIVAISLSYFKINFQTIYSGLLMGNLVSVATQYWIVLFGVGEIRTGNHNLLGNSITSYSCLIMLFPVIIYCLARNNNDRTYTVSSWTLLIASIPTLIYSGSRIALSVGLFVLVISAIVMAILKLIPFKKFWAFFGLLAATTIAFLILIGLFSSPQNKENLVRSTDVPISLYNRVTPDALNVDMYQLVRPDKPTRHGKKRKKNKDKELAEESIKLSNYMRVIINDKAKEKIFEKPQNTAVGIGMSSIYTKNWGYQKPHNLFLLYLLPFGFLGALMSYLILFGPLVLLLLHKVAFTKTKLLLLALTYFPTILISWHQPTLGTLIICLTFILVSFAEITLESDKIKVIK